MLMDLISRHFEDNRTSICKFIYKSILNASMFLQKYLNASMFLQKYLNASMYSVFKYICKKYLVFSI